ncbi:winged helix-turn-helix domain-containing protein, partial [Vibrio owensii]|uniref:winged helix-turn-helix domain-containing protein n=1 Tax=Vibrio owensii TaxID=696485 RepID=UPI003AB0C7E2
MIKKIIFGMEFGMKEQNVNLLIGEWVLNTQTGEVFNVFDEYRKKHLTSKPLLFVKTLVEGKGAIVTKTEIIDNVWGGYTSPENVTQVVNKLRVIFEDTNKEIFKNHPAKGYSLSFCEYFGPVDNKDEDRSSVGVINQKEIHTTKTHNVSSTKYSIVLHLIRYSGFFALLASILLILYKEIIGISVTNSVEKLTKPHVITIKDYTCE